EEIPLQHTLLEEIQGEKIYLALAEMDIKNLKPGEYSLIIRSRDQDGISEQQTEVKFTIVGK
ncbi:MAG: hypothetical protein JXB26_13470, partial [Candidatus Aminicenantes bacterium]|nr:hypothetical protein [Candidatus Aminicenantes bacterium]